MSINICGRIISFNDIECNHRQSFDINKGNLIEFHIIQTFKYRNNLSKSKIKGEKWI
jgi:hypothetical protein